MNKFLLAFLSLFSRFYESAGIDFVQLKAIVAAKLTMDNRRNNAAFMRGRHDKKESNNRFLFILAMYGFMGAFISLYIGMIPIPIVAMSIFHGFLMIMLAMTLITDYSSVLLDTADSIILLPRPVNSRTLFAARLTHVTLYIGQILFAVSLIPQLVVVIKYGALAWACLIVTMVFSALFAIFLTSLVYLIIMRFTSEENLKDAINYLQIGMAIFIFAFYQLMPRLFGIQDMLNIDFVPHLWHSFIPPLWMGGTMDAFISRDFGGLHSVFILACFTVPLFGIWVMNKFFSPYFSRKLSNLSTEYNENKPETPPSVMEAMADKSKTAVPSSSSFLTQLAAYVTTSAVENGVFQFVWKQLSRDRKLKLKLYPQFAYFFVIFIVLSFSFLRDEVENWTDIFTALADSKFYLLFIYLGSSTLSASLMFVPYSDDFRAAWIYYALPVVQPGDILVGSFKAQIIKFYLPFYGLLSVFMLLIWHFPVLDDIVFGFFNIIILALVVSLLGKRLLPFSEESNANETSGSFIRNFLSFFIFIFIALFHYLLTSVSFALLLLIPVQAFVIHLMIKRYRATDWKTIGMSAE